VNANELRQAWCCLQVKLCDPRLSALMTRYLSSRALYKSTYLYLLPVVNLGFFNGEQVPKVRGSRSRGVWVLGGGLCPLPRKIEFSALKWHILVHILACYCGQFYLRQCSDTVLYSCKSGGHVLRTFAGSMERLLANVCNVGGADVRFDRHHVNVVYVGERNWRVRGLWLWEKVLIRNRIFLCLC